MARSRRTLVIPKEMLARAKVLQVRLPPPEDDLEPGPRLICKGVVPGRAIPWKSPTITRTGGSRPGRGYKAYKGWQDVVRHHARTDMGRRRPYGGPVDLACTFYIRPIPGMKTPDRTNLLKAFEDALEGVCYRNDTQVEGGPTRRVISAEEVQRVEYEVWAT